MAQPWLTVTNAVVKIGSSSVKLACGTKRNVRARADWAMAMPRGKVVAAAAAAVRNVRRRMVRGSPGSYRWEHHGGRARGMAIVHPWPASAMMVRWAAYTDLDLPIP